MNPLKTTASKEIANKLDALYVTTRYRYLMQTPKTYVELNQRNNSKVFLLTPTTIGAHLRGKNAYGVFDANGLTKFMTFDVDFNDPSAAKWHTYRLIDVLCEDFNVRREDIHVSLSGSKGYHVDLFFDETIPTATAQAFYEQVMSKLGAMDGGMIEFRPTFKQGVKIPLGIHQRTGNRCYFCDTDTLEPIESLEHVLSIEPMPAGIILDALIELTPTQEEEFKQVARQTDATLTALTDSQARHKAAAILEAGQLPYTNNRHDTTLLLATFFYAQGVEQDEAVAAIMEVLHNTPLDYFSKGSTPKHWEAEAIRLYKYAEDRKMTLGNADKPVRVFKSEMLAVLSVGTFRQKQLAYAMLITSKRYGRTFFLAKETAKKMLGTKSNETIENAIKQLVKAGFIEYVRKGEIDRAASRRLGQKRFLTNKYRILIANPEKDEKFIDTHGTDLANDVWELCEEKEVQQRLPRRQFERLKR